MMNGDNICIRRAARRAADAACAGDAGRLQLRAGATAALCGGACAALPGGLDDLIMGGDVHAGSAHAMLRPCDAACRMGTAAVAKHSIAAP